MWCDAVSCGVHVDTRKVRVRAPLVVATPKASSVMVKSRQRSSASSTSNTYGGVGGGYGGGEGVWSGHWLPGRERKETTECETL